MAGKDVRELDVIPELMDRTLEMVAPQIEAIAKDINEWNDMYCLGYGATYPIALEGALKLKEITYAHCEGMLSTEFYIFIRYISKNSAHSNLLLTSSNLLNIFIAVNCSLHICWVDFSETVNVFYAIFRSD